MRIAVPRESRPDERRVALVPELVPRLTQTGAEIALEPGAGGDALYADDDYAAAGAGVMDDALDGADLLLGVQAPLPDQVKRLAPQAAVVSFLPIGDQLDLVRLLRDSGRTSFSMELIPRISRAQSMDALSSQAFVTGYRAALIAAERSSRLFPLSTTAAGTIAPAKVLVLGAGVAGLQAIATTRRLGAIVSAYDVREAAAEEVRSLGARFVDLDLPSLDGAGGYAREMSEERARRQQELLAPHVAASDVLITTAAVPGRPAPQLVTRDMVEAMSPGSVVVDVAAEQGGNVEGAEPGAELTIGRALVIGGRNVPSQLPAPASRLYAANVVNLALLMIKEGALDPDFNDDVLNACRVTHAGQVHHEPTRDLLANRVGAR